MYRWLLLMLMGTLLCQCANPVPADSEFTARPEARNFLGQGAPWQHEPFSQAELTGFYEQVDLRRAMAWRTVEKVLEQVELPGSEKTVPRFLTWYDDEDFERLFRRLYTGLSASERRQRKGFSPEAIAASRTWNMMHVEELPHWPSSRLEQWQQSLDSKQRLHSLAGLARTLWSPGAIEHLLESYAFTLNCAAAQREPSAPSPPAGSRSYCLGHEMPADAVVIKASWERADLGRSLPVYDTSAHALETRFEDPLRSWEPRDRGAYPEPESIFALTMASGETYWLTGLHIMTKELDDWVWISLWWSDDPEHDFGEDRPDSLKGGVWGHYKMCVSVAFDDWGSYPHHAALDNPSLAEALEVVKHHTGPHSWCSNPYLEKGTNNQISNCIGCHQHAGDRISPEQVLADQSRFPEFGRSRLRDDFPADYLWSLANGTGSILEMVRRRVRFHDRYDPYDLSSR